MRYYRVNKAKPEVKTVVNMENPAEINTPYAEAVPSLWEWKLPQEQVKIVNRLNDITRPENKNKQE